MVVVLGLTTENIKRLMAGKPMHLTRDTHGEGVPDGFEFFILHGESEAAIAESLSPTIGPDTAVHRDPKLNKTL